MKPGAFKRHLLIGALPEVGKVFVTVEFGVDGRLSITGVEGPLPNGNARGSCGQIVDALANPALTPAAGWTAADISKLHDIWQEWHLNDMRAGCEHQRATIDTTRQVEVVSYRLTREALKLRKDTRYAAAQAALAGEPFSPDATARALATIDRWYADVYAAPDADGPLSGCYEVSRREMKAIGWVTRQEHPEGMLSHPCEVCGYKYGSAWLREEVPADVVEWLRALPVDDSLPAVWW